MCFRGCYLLVYTVVLDYTMALSSGPDFDEPSTSNVNYRDDTTDDNFDNPPDIEDDSSTDKESEI